MPHRVLWTASEIAQGVSGELFGHFEATGVSIDTRTLQKGDLFIAIQGPKTDGHAYIKNALAAGAAGVIVSQKLRGEDVPFIVVNQTQRALEDLGQLARRRTCAKILAVTGSFGKTGSKEALRHVLSQQGKTSATESSFNNQWGVPLTLSRVFADDEYAIFELGMNHAGELTPLSQQVRPEVCLITAVGEVHLAHFGRIERIADAKAEIFNGMAPGSQAVLNRDNSQFERLARQAREKDLRLLTFGIDSQADFQAIKKQQTSEGFEVIARTPLGEITYTLNIPAEHWVMNSLGVLAMVYAGGGNLEQAARDFATFQLFPGRGQIHHVPYQGGTLTVIDESYNAGPESMKAALKVLGRIAPKEGGRRIAILGDMLELGDQSKIYHESLAATILEQSIDVVFTCGPEMNHLWKVLPVDKKADHDMEVDPLVAKVLDSLRPGDVIMAKGSRGQRAYRGRMSKFIDAMLALGHSQVA